MLNHYEAKDVDQTEDGMMEHIFTHAIVQRNTPGVFVYEFGRGKLSIEDVSNYLLSRCTTITEIMSAVDSLAKALKGHSSTKKMFKALFPAMSQQLQKNSVVMNTTDLNKHVAEGTGLTKDHESVATIAELVAEIFSDTSFITKSVGYSYREVREGDNPVYADLTKEFIKSELIDVLSSIPMRIKITATKFNPGYLLDEFQTILTRIGRAVERIGNNTHHLMNSLYAVNKYFTGKGSLINELEPDVMNSTELADLTSNITFVRAAYEANLSSPVGGVWAIMNSLRATVKILNLSPRYEILPLTVATAAYRYSTMVDGQSNLLGGVLSPAVKFSHPVNVGLFHEMPNLHDVTEATSLPDYDRSLGAMIDGLQGVDIMKPAHDACTQMLSVQIIKSTDDDPRSCLNVVDLINKQDLFLLALVKADKTYMVEKGASAGVVYFKKALNGKRLFAESIPFEGIIYTSDPATLLLACDDWDEAIPYDLGIQSTPTSMWDSFMLDPTEDLFHKFSGSRDFELTIGTEMMKITVDMVSLMRLIDRKDAKMIRNPISPRIYQNALSAIFGAYDRAMKVSDSDESEVLRVTLESQLGHILNGFMKPIYQSSTAKSVSDEVIRRMVRKVPPRNRDITYQRFHQVHYRRQLDLNITFLVLIKMGILDDIDDASGLSVLEQKFKTFMKDTLFYERLIGTDLSGD